MVSAGDRGTDICDAAQRSHHARMRIFALLFLITAASYACSSSSAPKKTPILASLKIISGASQTGTVGTALPSPIVVQALDSSGHPMAGLGVAYGPSSDGSVNPSSVTTDSMGKASTTWTLGSTAGADSLDIAVTESSVASMPTEIDTVTATANP